MYDFGNPPTDILALLASLKADGCNAFYIQTIGTTVKVTFYEQFKGRADIFPKACVFMGRDMLKHFAEVALSVLQQTENEAQNPGVVKQDLDKMN